MTWHSGPRELHKLNNLANIVTRLLRISFHQKMLTGDALLQAKGSPLKICNTYNKNTHAGSTKIVKPLPVIKQDMVKYIETKDFS